jgi:DNA uptake protein ComE-like DNA-binding protein
MKARILPALPALLLLVLLAFLLAAAAPAHARMTTKRDRTMDSAERPAAQLVELNTATVRELESLPGIGRELAKRIAAGRPYARASQLLKVKGIGRKRLAGLDGHAYIQCDTDMDCNAKNNFESEVAK